MQDLPVAALLRSDLSDMMIETIKLMLQYEPETQIRGHDGWKRPVHQSEALFFLFVDLFCTGLPEPLLEFVTLPEDRDRMEQQIRTRRGLKSARSLGKRDHQDLDDRPPPHAPADKKARVSP